MSKSLYNTLNVSKDASQEEIRAAYKQKAKDHHPDSGGSDEKMAEVNRAYMVLKDPVKRKRYDSTGEESEVSFEVKFSQLVNHILVKLIEVRDESVTDMVDVFMDHCRDHRTEMVKMKGVIEKKLFKLGNVISRLGDGKGRIRRVLEGNIEHWKAEKGKFEAEIKFLDDAMEVISRCEYRIDDIPEPDFVRQNSSPYTNFRSI